MKKYLDEQLNNANNPIINHTIDEVNDDSSESDHSNSESKKSVDDNFSKIKITLVDNQGMKSPQARESMDSSPNV